MAKVDYLEKAIKDLNLTTIQRDAMRVIINELLEKK